MSCSGTSSQFGPIPVWSKKSNSVWLFFPVSDPMDSTSVDEVRASFSLESSTGDLEVRPAFRMSNDGLTWDTPSPIGVATRATDGTTFGSTFVDISVMTRAKQLIQLGIEAKSNAGNGLENGMASMKADVRRK